MTVAGNRYWIGLLLALALYFASGCVESEVQETVPDSMMVDVLLELHLSVARAEVTNEVPANIRDSIFIAYDIDSAAYAQAIAYYAEHPEKYSEIYGQVLDRLNSERVPLELPSGDDAPRTPAPPPRTVP